MLLVHLYAFSAQQEHPTKHPNGTIRPDHNACYKSVLHVQECLMFLRSL